MARYGLPDHVEFCKICTLSNQKVTPSVVTEDAKDSKKHTVIFKDGICEPCRVHLRKQDTIDWDARERELVELLDKNRSTDGKWDCIVPGSGGKDSVYQSHILRTKYNMNPLTVTWSPHIYTDVGWHNFQSWINVAGHDNFLFTPSGRVHRKLTRLAYTNLLHPFQPFVFGQRNYVMHMARKFNIPLIFFGESAAEYGGEDGDEEDPRYAERYYVRDPDDSLLVAGLSLEELEQEHQISKADLQLYLPIERESLTSFRPNPHFLGYYLKFIPQDNFYYAVEHADFKPNDQRTEGTYSKYNSIDDRLDGFHYWTGFIKFGVGRCTHEASQEIRNGHITREEGVRLVQKYDGEFPERYFQDFLDYMEMDEQEFFAIADSFRSEHLWEFVGNQWKLKHQVK